jgi:hypothetical protein
LYYTDLHHLARKFKLKNKTNNIVMREAQRPAAPRRAVAFAFSLVAYGFLACGYWLVASCPVCKYN